MKIENSYHVQMFTQAVLAKNSILFRFSSTIKLSNWNSSMHAFILFVKIGLLL